LEAKTLANLALLMCNQALDGPANEYAHQALALAQHGAFGAIAAETHFALGYQWLDQERYGEAEQTYRKALHHWQQTGQLHRIVLTQSGLALSLLGQAGQEEALQVVEAILNTLTTRPQLLKCAFVFFACTQVLRALQDQRASAILQQGYHALQQQAATITDPALRAKFLTNVPTNRKLLALVGQG
jgi:tetratricopeptide (TPR) repeat protein